MQNGEGDSNDFWRIEIEGGEERQILETMKHRFRLIHHNLGCALTLTKKQYPQWYCLLSSFFYSAPALTCVLNRGFEQEEVTCNPNTKQSNSLWNIEDNRYPRCKSAMKM